MCLVPREQKHGHHCVYFNAPFSDILLKIIFVYIFICILEQTYFLTQFGYRFMATHLEQGRNLCANVRIIGLHFSGTDEDYL